MPEPVSKIVRPESDVPCFIGSLPTSKQSAFHTGHSKMCASSHLTKSVWLRGQNIFLTCFLLIILNWWTDDVWQKIELN
jgi:hypothetical protein